MDQMRSVIRWPLSIILLLVGLSGQISAQKDLKAVQDETTSILGDITGNTNKIERATLTKEDERSVTVSLRFTGFEDKTYKIQTSVLNAHKDVMTDITPATLDMPKSKQADIAMSIADTAKPASQGGMESKYLRVKVAPVEGGIMGTLSETFDELNLNAQEFLFEMPKTWMLSGANVKVAVKLTPYKNAASIPN